MPELPEVERVVKNIRENALHKKIIDVKILKKGLVKNPQNFFISSLKGKKFESVERRGKLMIISLSGSDAFLLLHMKMTGQIIYGKKRMLIPGGHYLPKTDKLPNKYTYIKFIFQDQSSVFFNDMRKFGYIKIVSKLEKNNIINKFGIEPFNKSFSLKYLSSLLKSRKTSIKAFLLNQKNIAGIGNIYSDEICFQAGILPSKKTYDLSQSEVMDLYKSIREVLQKAIRYGGTTFNQDGKKNRQFILVYKKEGQPCMRCGKGVIAKKKDSGRAYRYCPHCQK